jgi:nitroreductase
MELHQCLTSRRSIRAFIGKEVGRPVLQKMIEAANRSPSYMNS